MSANQWSVCPRCRQTAAEEHKAAKKRLTESYGEVDKAEYDRLQRQLENFNEKLPDTLREVWEFQLINGSLNIYYGCTCEACNFKFDFVHEEPVRI